MEQKRLQKQSNKGITLIALIITVIVMLILAGVAINMTIGDNGIFKKTAETVVIHENAEVYEQLCLKIVDDELGDRIENTKTDKLSKLKSDGYMDENGIVNVEAVTKRKMKTGNGNLEIGDLYGIVSIENEYYLIYLDKNKKEKVLGKLFEISEDELLEPTPEDYFEFAPETGGIALKNGTSYYSTNKELGLKTIVIPSTYQGQTVTKIGKKMGWKYGTQLEDLKQLLWGFGWTEVEKIVIPNTVIEIGELIWSDSAKGAFESCSNLKEVVIPNSVKIIGNSTFKKCSSLQEITIPTSVTNVGSYAFYHCTNLQKIYVPFKEGEQPEGWDVDWNKRCDAQIIYKD